MKKVAVVLGSDSDLKVVEKTISTLKEFSVPYEVHILSAHRTPDQLTAFAKSAESSDISLIIAAAGKAAHLGGVIASHTVLPVIAIPIDSSLNGLDALLSTVQMPSGIPVATVAVNGALNAALLAIQILSINEPVLLEKLKIYRQNNTQAVLEKNNIIEEIFNIKR